MGANESRHIGLRRDLDNQLFNLTHALVLRVAKDLLVIVLSEVSGKLVHSTQVELSARDHAKNAGKSVGRTACPDALGRNCLRHVKALRTKREHRGERMLEVQLSPIDLGDVREHGRGVAPVFADQSCEVAEQLVLVEMLKRARFDHGLTLT